MTQGQLQQMFHRAGFNPGVVIGHQFGNDNVSCMYDGRAVEWQLNGKRIEWDKLQANCDDY
ncbi:hypothetical protein 8G_00054 [Ralstonia phage Hyacinthe]|uniref:Uncharacterized protein n=3 Tax=Rahariannevirus raharianne TaxID=2846050 RepID=A0A7G5BBG9_9CAUD|nr:hypothetical protein KMC43_gp73 [Ralstonia phage Raharianne]QMV32448.1 hypothetical protein U2_00073 [Ralstonia phage Albius]QMV33486.1 hypothetical protein 8G_00054 [Ralstonia phage Hyacinthe]QMV33642.1 hypothetical protein Y2_00073 [Ralstonia phage Raharianne]